MQAEVPQSIRPQSSPEILYYTKQQFVLSRRERSAIAVLTGQSPNPVYILRGLGDRHGQFEFLKVKKQILACLPVIIHPND